MDISTKLANAQAAAARIPVLNACLTLLEVQDPDPARIEFYSDPAPSTPGDPPTGDLVVTLPLNSSAGSVDTDLFQVQLTVPIEGQITGADPALGTAVTWARIVDGEGDWFADVSVSDEAGSGEIKLQTTTLYNGAYCRLTSAILQG